MSNPKVIYLGPACQEQSRSGGREWCQDDVWDACECGSESVRYVLGADFDRVTAERDAALGREAECQRQLGERWKDIDTLKTSLEAVTFNLDKTDKVALALQKSLTAADERADVLEGLLLQTNELLYAIQGDPGAAPSSAIDAMRGEVFTALKPVERCTDSPDYPSI